MSTLTGLFTNIANAIRSHKDQQHQGEILAEDFPAEIEAIQTGELTSEEYQVANDDVDDILTNTNVPSTTINIIENGLYDIRDYAEADVNVSVNLDNYYANNITEFGARGLIKSIPNDFDITVIQGHMDETFSGFTNLTTIPSFNIIGTLRSVNMLFSNCRNITTTPNFDTSLVTNAGGMFHECHNLTSIPNYDFSNLLNMSNMFSNCRNLITTHNFNVNKVTTIENMFRDCHNLVSVPNYDFSNVTQAQYTFYNCHNLTDAPIKLDNPNLRSVGYMFAYCENLSVIPNIDWSHAQYADSLFCGRWFYRSPRY